MIIFLYGTNSFLRHNRIHVLTQGFQKKHDAQGVNITRIWAEEFDIDEFRKHTKSAGLFVQKRFVVLYDIWKLSKEIQEQLINECNQVDEHTILCISAELPPRKDNVLFKKLLTADVVEEYSDLNYSQLKTFIEQECKKQQATIDAQATQRLMNTFGNDLWSLAQEIHKLAHYAPHITLDAVALFSEPVINDNIFQLTDALGKRDLKTATQSLEEQLQSNPAPQPLIAVLARHISTLLKVKQTQGKGLQLHSFVLEKSLVQAKQFTGSELLGLYWKLLTIDQRIKTTSTDPRALLHTFLIEACTT